jgi:branched-chain amino acid transport system permease protein
MSERAPGRTMTRVRSTYGLGYLVLVAALLSGQLLLTGNSEFYIANLIMIQAIAALGVNVTIGYAGLLSIAHAAIMAIGAYVAVLTAIHFGVPFPVALLLGVLACCFVSALVGLIGMRVAPTYFLLVTAAFAFLVYLVITNESGLTGGAQGIYDLPEAKLGSYALDTDTAWYPFLACSVVVGLFLADRLRASRAGHAMFALRQNATVARISGVPVERYRLLAMTFGGAFLGFAGGCSAYLTGFLGRESFPFSLTLQLIVIVVIGGIGSNVGTLVAAAGVVLAAQQFQEVGDQWVFWYGLLIVVMLIVAPRGLAGVATDLRRLVRRWSGRGQPVPRAEAR